MMIHVKNWRFVGSVN